MNYGFKAKGSSKWSLTSSETDYTIDDKSEYSGDVTYSHSLRECLDNFNKEMDSLNKGSIEMGGSSPNILSGTKTKILEETEFTTKSEDVLAAAHINEINNNMNGDQNVYENSDASAPSVLISQENDADNIEIHLNHFEEKVPDDVNGNHVEDEEKDNRNVRFRIDIEGRADDEEGTVELEKGHEEIIIYTETKDMDHEEEFSIDETKLAYIDQENGAQEQNDTENSEDYSEEPSPIPKLRTIKLDKDALLGDRIPK